ncbi:hypothetical protein ASE23_28120, partial [Rhizobium sp. Root73]
SVVSFRLVLSNPTLPEITDGYEIQLHHSLGHDLCLGFMQTDNASIVARIRQLAGRDLMPINVHTLRQPMMKTHLDPMR